MNLMQAERSIIHLDLDAFYASVEELDYPELRGLPIIVGGSRDRGVVCACSYPARRYGVRSAMAMAKAMRLCPQAVVRSPRIKRYGEVSREVFAIFARYTDCIEPLSVDEAFLDVTGCERLFGPAGKIAAEIRKTVSSEIGLSISAGVAGNKFLAKLGSEQAKPDGLFIVPDPPESFLLPLPLGRLWGVGPVMLKSLENQGLRSVADLRRMSRESLQKRFGAMGEHLYRLARGEDSRPVEPFSEVKSVGHEDTFERDLWDRQEMHRALLDLAERVAARLRRKGLCGASLTLKVKYADFSTVTRSRTLDQGINHAMDIYHQAVELMGRTAAGEKAVRLLGISLGRLQNHGDGQTELFGIESRQRQMALDQAVDSLRGRFGFDGIRRASLLEGPSGPKPGREKGDGSK
ncbi:MAG: DNA polymerase IV [Syntrophotaleaceae bacterium]